MNNDLEQFGIEHLKEMLDEYIYPLDGFSSVPNYWILHFARIALAAKQAKPVTMDSLRDAVAEISGGVTMKWEEGNDKGHHAVPFINFNSLHRIVTKFTTPQPAHAEQVIPDGWKLVPIEPTEDMLKAGCRFASEHNTKGSWSQMLAAAPKPESD